MVGMMSKKTVKKILKHLVHLVEVLLALFFILTFILFFRLSQGPIEIQALTPMVQKALRVQEIGLSLDIKTIYLQLGLKKGRLIDIALVDMRLLEADGKEMLVVPEASIAFQIFPLFKGEFVPSFLSLSDPTLALALPTTQQTAESAPVSPALIEHSIATLKNLLDRLRYIEHLSMQNGTMHVLADQKDWLSLTRVQADLFHVRGGRIGLHAAFHIQYQKQDLPLDIRAEYAKRARQLSATVAFQDVNLARLLPQVELFKGIKSVFKGQVQAQVDLSKENALPRQMVSDLTFDVESTKAGDLYLPAPIDTTYPLKQVKAHGHATPELTALYVDEAQLSLGQTSATARVDITGLDRLLDAGALGEVKTVLNATVRDVPTEKVPDVWPATIGADVHTWVKENLTKGKVPTADFKLDFAGADITKIYGAVQVQDAQVRYLEGMSPVEGVNGVVYLAQDTVDIDITSGHIGPVSLTKGALHFLDLEDKISRTEMSLDVAGPLPNILKVADEEPLALVRDFGIDIDAVQGDAKANISLAFPFLDDLSAKDIKVHVTGEVTQGYFPVPELSSALTDGAFHVDITEKKLSVSGQAKLENSVVSISWDENFIKSKKPKTVYSLKGDIDSSVVALGYADAPSVWKGTALADVKLTESFDNVVTVQASADLTQAEILFFPLNYTKAQGVAGHVTTEIRIAKDVQLKKLQLIVPADKVKIEGQGHFGATNRLEFPVIQAPNNNFALTFEQGKAAVVKVTGQAWDLTQILHTPFDSKSSSTTSIPDFSLALDLEKMYFSATPFHKAHFDIALADGRFTKAEGKALAAAPLEMTLNKNTLYITNDDLGDLLSRLGYTQRVQKGLLRFQTTPMKNGGFEGTVFIKDYEVAETSFLMQSLTILGIVDAIRGKNMTFDEGTFPFVWSPDGALTLTDGVTYGTAVGITLSGTIQQGELALKGSVIPAYAINSLPGKVPLIGRLFSGDKGGGLVGVAFEIVGKTSDPQMNFAPSSLLTPGIFRNLFN